MSKHIFTNYRFVYRYGYSMYLLTILLVLYNCERSIPFQSQIIFPCRNVGNNFLQSCISCPFTHAVDSTLYLLAPFIAATMELATAMPRSLWQWTLIIALSIFLTFFWFLYEFSELNGSCISNGVRNVYDCGTVVYCRFNNFIKELEPCSRCIHRRVFYLVGILLCMIYSAFTISRTSFSVSPTGALFVCRSWI